MDKTEQNVTSNQMKPLKDPYTLTAQHSHGHFSTLTSIHGVNNN